ncbi:MAG TPA: aminoacyl-tRNA hydrolase [Acidimicrobiales bacterium]|nr:aminoacyl-tRNA hydrolase [Acidimicrobiales bacterium]
MGDTPLDLLVVGLGNPGAQYVGTRHNVGADVAFLLAERYGGRLKLSKKERTLLDEVRIGAKRVALAFPQTYMNESGFSVGMLARRYDLTEDDAERIVIVHDELDLPPASVKVKRGGGLAGHNGLRSIKAHLKTDGFLRVRIGIGKPPGGKERGVDHVLRRPSKQELESLVVSVHEAADAVEKILNDGVDRAMELYNRREKSAPQE